jgi:hypothetical protein
MNIIVDIDYDPSKVSEFVETSVNIKSLRNLADDFTPEQLVTYQQLLKTSLSGNPAALIINIRSSLVLVKRYIQFLEETTSPGHDLMDHPFYKMFIDLVTQSHESRISNPKLSKKDFLDAIITPDNASRIFFILFKDEEEKMVLYIVAEYTNMIKLTAETLGAFEYAYMRGTDFGRKILSYFKDRLILKDVHTTLNVNSKVFMDNSTMFRVEADGTLTLLNNVDQFYSDVATLTAGTTGSTGRVYVIPNILRLKYYLTRRWMLK